MLVIVLLLILTLFIFSLNRKKNSRVLSVLVLVLFNWFVIEIACYGYFLYAASQGDAFFLIGHQKLLDNFIEENIIRQSYAEDKDRYSKFRIDPDLGYVPGANKFIYQFPSTNSQGLRSDREYPLIAPADRLRLAVFGDSFVYGDGEVTQNVWPHILEHSVKNLEVLNFGVSGYGLGQSYLRYMRDGLKFHPDIIFFNYVLIGNRDNFSVREMMQGRGLRNADVYRVRFGIQNGELTSRSMTPLDLFDPAFREQYIDGPQGRRENSLDLSSRILTVSNVGLFIKQWLMKREFQKSAKAGDSADLPVNLKMLENLLTTAELNGTSVIFFYDVDFTQLPLPVQKLLQDYSKTVVYVNSGALLEMLFKKHGVTRQELMNATNHFNARGNQIYAEAMAIVLSHRVWGSDERRFRFDEIQDAFVPVE